MHDGMPYGRNQGQGQGHSREVDRQSPTGLIFKLCKCIYTLCLREKQATFICALTLPFSSLLISERIYRRSLSYYCFDMKRSKLAKMLLILPRFTIRILSVVFNKISDALTRSCFTVFIP